jgi:hypothetical protein
MTRFLEFRRAPALATPGDVRESWVSASLQPSLRPFPFDAAVCDGLFVERPGGFFCQVVFHR